MAKNEYRVGAFAVLAIVLLRLAIGIQFLGAGIEKLDPSFTSEHFLRGATGPMADYYKSMAPYPHDFDNLADKPWPESFQYEEERRYYDSRTGEVQESRTTYDDLGFIPAPTEAYGPWIAKIAEDWNDIAHEFKKLPGLSEEQRTAIDETYEAHYRSLAYFAEVERGSFEEWHHEVERLEKLKEERKNDDAPYMAGRIADKKSETAGMWRPLLAGVKAEEELYKADLKGLLTDEQLKSATLTERAKGALNPPGPLATVNSGVMWFTLVVGFLLITGLFTRLTSVAAAGFLLSVMSTQPIWAEGVVDLAKALFPYQGIEIFALLVLAGLGAGRWAGLDGVLFGRKDD